MARGYAEVDDEEEGPEGQAYQPEEESYGMTPGWSAPTERGGFAGLSVGNTPPPSGYMPREGEGGYEAVNEPYQPGVSHGYQMPAAGEQADAPPRTGLEGVVPPLMNYGGHAVLKGNDGQPVVANGQPVTLDQYHRAFMSSQYRGPTPEQQAAARGSSLRWEQQSQGGGDDLHPAAHIIYDQLHELRGMRDELMASGQAVAQNPQTSPAQKTAALRTIQEQIGRIDAQGSTLTGKLATFAQQASMAQGKRQAAVNAGLHPDYGTPAGPELDPRLQQQVQDAEFNIQNARDDPKLSTSQKLHVVQAMSNKLSQIDPAGRYRNGMQPMSAVQKAMAQTVYHDEDKGIVYAYDPKTGRVTPHFEKAEKVAKVSPSSFDELPLKDRDKMLHDEMREYNIGPQQAYQQIMQRHAVFAQGSGAQGQPQAMDPRQAASVVQQHLMGDPRVDTATARKAYDAMHHDTLWQVHEAAGDVDEQMKTWEQRRQSAAASGMPFSMPGRAAVESRAARARAILQAPAAQGMVAPAPLLTARQRQAQEADATKKAAADAKAAEKNQYEAPDLMKLRLQAMNEWKAMNPHEAGSDPVPPTEAWVQAHVADLRKMHKADWESNRPAPQGPNAVQGVPLGTTRELLAPKAPADHYFDAIEAQAVRAGDGDGQRASRYVREALAQFHNVSAMPEPVRQEYVLRLKLLQKYDSKIRVPGELEPSPDRPSTMPPGNTFQSTGTTRYGSTGTYQPTRPKVQGDPRLFPR